MKRKATLLAVAVVALQVAAFAAPTSGMSASRLTIEKQKIHVVAPLIKPSTMPNYKIERVGGMSSRPWTKIVGWHPGASAFPNADTHEAEFAILSFGAEPEY